jgi:hypothetical protein
MSGDGSKNAITAAQAQLYHLTIDCEMQLDKVSAERNRDECQLDEMSDRCYRLNDVIAKGHRQACGGAR